MRGRLEARGLAVVVLASPSDERVAFVATVNRAGIDTGWTTKGLVEVFAPVCGARGAAAPTWLEARAGDAAKLPAAFDAVRSSLLTTS